MSATNAFETDLLELFFTNVTIAHVGDAGGIDGSTSAGSVQVSINTVALSDTSTVITSNECSYTGYSRPTVARSGAGWTVSGNTVDNAALIQFGQNSGTSQTAVHAGFALSTTTTNCSVHADLDSDLVISNGINPQFAIGELNVTLD